MSSRVLAVLPNSALWDQGAPPLAARSARRVGNVACIHRGTAGYRSAHAGRPARRSPPARNGSAPNGGASDRASCNITSSPALTLCPPGGDDAASAVSVTCTPALVSVRATVSGPGRGGAGQP